MTANTRTTALEVVSKLFEPLVRLMLDLGIGGKEAEDLLRSVFVNTTAAMLAKSVGKPASGSMVALRCGLPRKDVARRLRMATVPDGRFAQKMRLNRILSGWRSDPRFLLRSGDPRSLPLVGRQSFAELVSLYAPGVRPAVMLRELVRVRAVEQMPDGRLRSNAESLHDGEVQTDVLRNAGEHAALVIESLRTSLTVPSADAFSAGHVSYAIDPRQLPRLERVLRDRIAVLIETSAALLDAPEVATRDGLPRGTRLGVVAAIVGDVRAKRSALNAGDVTTSKSRPRTSENKPIPTTRARKRARPQRR